MPALKLKLLGPLQLWRGDVLITPEEWPTRKSRDLLLILLTECGHVVPNERLMDCLWAGLRPRAAANNLRVSVSHLRRVLQPDLPRAADSAFVITRPPGYLFRVTPACWLDVQAFQDAMAKGHEFERRAEWGPAIAAYQAAEALYRGDYLEEKPYADWAIGLRERLRDSYLALLSRLAECYARQGHWRRALAACQKSLSLDDLRESVYRQMMVYHYRLGQRDQALRVFQRCRGLLVQELGVDPMPQTLDLYTRMLKAEEVGTPQLVHPVPAGAQPGRRLPAWLPLVGRRSEMELLAGHLAAAAAGSGHLVLISGEAGAGKTRLALELLAQAEEYGANVLHGQAFEPEQDLSYQPLREALRRYLLHQLDPKEAGQVLGDWGSPVALLIPELRQVLVDLPLPPPLPHEAERHRLLIGLTQLCLSLAARQPLVLFLDDLQWSDPSTLRFAHHLARHSVRHRVLVLGCYRREALAPAHPLVTLEHHLLAEGLATRLELPRLSPDAVDQLFRQKAAPGWASEAFGRRLYQDTEGNPLFLAEVLRNLLDCAALLEDESRRWHPKPGMDLTGEALPIPATVQAVIETRCQAVSAVGQRVLRSAAVIGREFTFDLMQDVLAMDTESILDGLEELVARQLIHEHLEPDHVGYSFTHHRIREVLVEGLSPARRIHLHRQVARALEAQYQGQTDKVAAQLGHHYAQAREGEKAIDYLLMAGDRARTLYAHKEAIEHYLRALSFLDEQHDHERAARTWMKLGLAYQIGFDHRQARRAYNRGLALWQRTGAVVSSVRSSSSSHGLRVDWSLGLRTLDPGLAGDTASSGVVDQLFSGLVEQGPEMDVVPDIAHSWEVSEGGRRYVFHLRDDVQWSDGARVSATDFEYAWKRVLDPALNSPLASLLFNLKGARAFHSGERNEVELGIRAHDPTTLLVELEQPASYFLHVLTYNVTYPVPRHAVEAHGHGWTDARHIVTNGPFLLEAWQPHESLRLRRNPGYHGRFRGNVDQVELSLIRDPLVRLAMYEAGEIDFLRIPYPPPPEMERARQHLAEETLSLPMLHTDFVGFDVRRSPFDDTQVRRAFVHAIDRTTLAEVVLQGYVAPALGGFVPPSMPGHDPTIGLAHDPDRARAILAGVGYPHPRSFPQVEALVHRAGDWVPLCRFLEAQWSQTLGVDIRWQPVDAAQLFDRLDRDPPHLFLVGWNADFPDPDSFLGVSLILRSAGWRSSAYDGLLEQARRVTDQEQRMRLYRQADRMLMQQAVIVPLSYGREHRLVKPWVKQLPASIIKWWFWKDVVVEGK